jgi:hypothetical protein
MHAQLSRKSSNGLEGHSSGRIRRLKWSNLNGKFKEDDVALGIMNWMEFCINFLPLYDSFQ